MRDHEDLKAGRFAPPETRRVIRAFGDEIHLHLGTAETGGQFSLWTNVTPPGGGPPPHYHLHEDELFLPLEGRASFLHGDAWHEVDPGTTVFMPRGTVHTFKNVGGTPLRLLIQTMPGGFEEFFDRCAEEFAVGGPPDFGKIVEISAEFGVYYPA